MSCWLQRRSRWQYMYNAILITSPPLTTKLIMTWSHFRRCSPVAGRCPADAYLSGVPPMSGHIGDTSVISTVAGRSPAGDRPASDSNMKLITHRSPSGHRPMIGRCPDGTRPMCHRCMMALRAPADVRPGIGRYPAGHRPIPVRT